METPKHSWSGPEDEEFTPAVDSEHLKRAWTFIREECGQRSGAIAIGRGLWEKILPDTNIDAVTYRNAMLELLKHFTSQVNEHRSEVDPELAQIADELRGRLSGDTLDDAVFNAMSRIPLRWMKSKGPQGLPFDIREFLAQVEQEA